MLKWWKDPTEAFPLLSFSGNTLVLVWYWVYMIFEHHQYYTNTSILVLVLHHNTPRIAHPCYVSTIYTSHITVV